MAYGHTCAIRFEESAMQRIPPADAVRDWKRVDIHRVRWWSIFPVSSGRSGLISIACALGLWTGIAPAQEEPSDRPPNYAQRIIDGKVDAAPTQAESRENSSILPASCRSCGSLPAPMITGSIEGGAPACGNGCPTGHCVPGRQCPECCGGGGCGCGVFGRLCGNLYECLCCPDPCYEPTWIPTANAAFFVDHARPKTYMKIGWDAGIDLVLPDRNEFFWAKAGGKGPSKPELTLNYNELKLYNEVGAGGFGFFMEEYYRLLEPDRNGWDAGWGDLTIGTKSMFVDCELMQLTFQF